jgi:hypothetical protein
MELIIGLVVLVVVGWFIFFRNTDQEINKMLITPQKDEIKPEPAPAPTVEPAPAPAPTVEAVPVVNNTDPADNVPAAKKPAPKKKATTKKPEAAAKKPAAKTAAKKPVRSKKI